MNTSSISRRRFLQRSLSATGASVVGFPAVVSSKSPNAKMNIGFIAAGGRAGAHIKEAQNMPQLVDVVAMCDVNSKNLEYAAAQFPGVRTYKDFREMHAKMDDIDAVFIATTEHTHAFATIP
ncbi:MAG TPA: Gfo/Idh/MocA family oxidoreductase, partial [Verrucomicrobiaceae bacterium]